MKRHTENLLSLKLIIQFLIEILCFIV